MPRFTIYSTRKGHSTRKRFCERPGLIANRSNRAFKDRWLDFYLTFKA